MVRKNSRCGKPDERLRHFLNCREQPPWKYFRPGNDFPYRANDHEWEEIAHDRAQPIADLRPVGDFAHRNRGRYGILHRVPTSSQGPIREPF